MPHRRCHGSVSGIGCTSAGGVRHDEAFQNGKGGGDEEGHEEERTDAEKNSYTRATGVACDEALLDGGGNGEEEEEEEDRGGCEEEMEKEEECLEEFLRRLTGEENLGLVQNLLLTAVDTNVTQVGLIPDQTFSSHIRHVTTRKMHPHLFRFEILCKIHEAPMRAHSSRSDAARLLPNRLNNCNPGH